MCNGPETRREETAWPFPCNDEQRGFGRFCAGSNKDFWLIGNLNDILWRAAQGIKPIHVECDSSHFLKETRMKKILIPCDGSDNALRAVRYAASVAKERTDVELELLNVQDPMQLGTHATRSVQEIEQMQAGEANRILQPAKQLLDAEQVPYHVRCRIGSPSGPNATPGH